MDRLASQQPDLPSLRSWFHQRSAAERRTLARLWRLEPGEDNAGADALLEELLTPEGVAALLSQLRPADRAALERLQAEGGVVQARILEREFGTIREHRAYPNPRAYLEALSRPSSATERLFVLGLIQELRTRAGPAYAIPTELMQLLPPVPPRDRRLRLPQLPEAAREVALGDPAQLERWLVGLLAAAYEQPLPIARSGALRRPSNRRALAHLATLADDGELTTPLTERTLPQLGFLRHVALELGLLRRSRSGLCPTPAALKWLELPALERRRSALQAWLTSQWDELTALCNLRWRAEPLRHDRATARKLLLELLAQLQPGQWFALEEWVAEIRRVEPDYLRPDGIYDSWMLVDQAGRSLVGFQHWHEVEGQLARALIVGPLAWLGLVDLARRDEQQDWQAARLSAWGAALLAGAPAPAVEEERLVVEANFTVFVPPLAPLLPRFQLSRIAEREGHGSFAIYRLTRERLNRALDRGIGIEEILTFLARWSIGPVPQNVTYTLREWATAREALRLRPRLILEANEPLLLEQLRRDRRVALPPAQPLTEQHWLLSESDGPALVAELRRTGYGVTAELPDRAEPLSERDLVDLLTYAEVVAQLTTDASLAGGPSNALRRRLEKRLSSTALAAARRNAAVLVRRLRGHQLEKENLH